MMHTPPPPAEIQILAHNRTVIRPCSTAEIQLLLGGHCADRHALLMQLRDAKQWVLCPCGRLLHPVTGRPAFLRLHHNDQEIPPPGLGCALCERAPAGQVLGGRGSVRRRWKHHPGLVLHTPTWDGEATGAGLRLGRRELGERYGSQRSCLRYYMERAGWHQLGSALHPGEVWRQLRLSLRGGDVRLRGGAHVRVSDLTWMPDEPLTPSAHAWQVARDWPGEQVVPEMWLIAVVERSGIRIDGGEVEISWTDQARRTGCLRLPRTQVAWTVCTPPYLLFAAGHATPDLTTWTPHRVVLEGIVSARCPVPVDSGEERRAVLVLQEMGFAYQKMLFPVDGVWPDFVLPEQRIILEVQGTRRDGYTERKARTHGQMRARFPGWELLTWDVIQGETPSDLRKKLFAATAR